MEIGGVKYGPAIVLYLLGTKKIKNYTKF